MIVGSLTVTRCFVHIKLFLPTSLCTLVLHTQVICRPYSQLWSYTNMTNHVMVSILEQIQCDKS